MADFTSSTAYKTHATLDVNQTYHFVSNVFDVKQTTLANLYKSWGRVLAVVDHTIYSIHHERIHAYFTHHGIKPTIISAYITEDGKSVETMLEICKWMTDFNIIRREPALLIGGGLLTDVAGRTTRYIRIPTSLIGLIDASVSNRVAVNWNGLKNRIGGYHEPTDTIIDPTFLRTLPEAEIRNGISEILKITSTTHLQTFETVEKLGDQFIKRRFGHIAGDNGDLDIISDKVIRQSIQSVLELEVPNSREQSLDRVMYFGHTWSPVLELAAEPHLLHGHAIAVDMCFSATLAHHLNLLPTDQYHRFLSVFSNMGLAIDHPEFTLANMVKGTHSTIATRDNKLRAPVPTGKLGTHKILAMVDDVTLEKVWHEHKAECKSWPRGGLGIEMDLADRVEREALKIKAPSSNAVNATPGANVSNGVQVSNGVSVNA